MARHDRARLELDQVDQVDHRVFAEKRSTHTLGELERDLVFISGCVPVDAEGRLVGGDDVVAQTRQVLRNIEAVLAGAGATFADVAKVTVYLVSVDDRQKINPVRHEFFGDARPASTLVDVSRLAVPGARIEIEAVAVVRG